MISGTPVLEHGHFGHILVMKMLYFFYNFVEACKLFLPPLIGSSSCVKTVTFVGIYFISFGDYLENGKYPHT